MSIRGYLLGLLVLTCSAGRAQNALPENAATTDNTAQIPPAPTSTLSTPSFEEKWQFFIHETATPLLFVEVVPDATASQLTRSAPLYGRHFWRNHAYLKRFGATAADDTTQNFFADFVLASAFHEDTRYVRAGSAHHGVLWRVGYAVSRSVVTHTDSGERTFSWANVLGCAMSAALSNAYYPPVSRTPGVALTNWGTNVAGSGLTNFMPEFGPDLAHFFKRHLFRRK